jgi:Tol biopolymer transport system component
MKRRVLNSLALCYILAAVGPFGAPGVAAEATARFLATDPGANDYWPCFSPDGEKILFSRTVDGGKTWDVFVVPASGGEAHKLSDSRLPVSATRANWSPRSNLIAFTGTSSDDKSSVWLIQVDGIAARQLISPGLSNTVFYPSFYPDGERLAVIDAVENVIKRIDMKQGVAVAVTDRQKVLSGMPSVSPDGKWIAFAGQKNTGQAYDQSKNSIWLISETGALRSLEAIPSQGRTPAWSADGQWLAFESNRGDSTHQLYAVFIVKRDGIGLRQITPYELNANHPVWSPDAKRLAFSAHHHTKGTDTTGIALIEVNP